MKYSELFAQDNAAVAERYDLAVERISNIPGDVGEPFRDYFHKMADFVAQMDRLYKDVEQQAMEDWTMEALKAHNDSLYNDILPENYETSYANPDYAAQKLGSDYGPLLSFLYTELRGMIAWAYESRKTQMTIIMELLIEIYNYFEDASQPDSRFLKQAIYWYISDYSDMMLEDMICDQVDERRTFIKDIICESDLGDLSYLYRYGEYVGENEIQTALYLNKQPKERILALSDTFVDGYIRGFKVMGVDLAPKNNLVIRAHIGFERVLKESIHRFEAMGLTVHMFRNPVSSCCKKSMRYGFLGTSPNPQYDYDHRQDQALYLDKALNERRLAVLRVVYEKYKKQLDGYAGPAVMEVFGEEPFVPLRREYGLTLSEKQQKLSVDYAGQSGLLQSQYIDSAKTSFTIIAYPIPEIGDDFEAIFDEIFKVNTLDNRLYTCIQQTMIDTLDKAQGVWIRGAREKNSTDLYVNLRPLAQPAQETKFENCVADVNIPAGEVFTSPVLKGTTGRLNVSSVYLKGYNFNNLTVVFKDGMAVEYSCDNFGREEENRQYIRENILFNHETLPIGEFAIGTNTTAYVMAEKYKIIQKLPILIVEKMGPHFALGDTCYARSEAHKVYNPDGKEIIARDNEISALRHTNPQAAYFNCHTDITIPYDEIGEISAVMADGSKVPLILDGRFVLPGTESLNAPFEEKQY